MIAPRDASAEARAREVETLRAAAGGAALAAQALRAYAAGLTALAAAVDRQDPEGTRAALAAVLEPLLALEGRLDRLAELGPRLQVLAARVGGH